MKRWMSALVAALVIAIPASAQDNYQSADEMSEEQKMMMEIMQNYGSPGPEHAHMDALIGAWTYTSEAKMAPDGEAMASTGSAEYTWAHDKRYLMQTVHGNMGGMAFTGTGIMGFDRYSGELFSLWIDSMSTGTLMSTGEVGEDGKTFSVEGTYDDPWTGQKDKWTRTVITVTGEDTHRLDMYTKDENGEPWVNFTINYSRAEMASK